jgi:hypothetical protein
VVGLGQGTTQQGEGDAGSTLSKVSTEGARRNNGTKAALWDTASSGARQRRPPSVLVLRMGREHKAVREREAVWEGKVMVAAHRLASGLGRTLRSGGKWRRQRGECGGRRRRFGRGSMVR